ncbi:MAG: hypothetical protein CMK32_03445 [Porticoccaceae bacterium]|nr:hypothetical protein [Porticoccaceae bacterium]
MSEQDSPTPKTKITLEMSAEDAERFVQAYNDGKLAGLGVLSVEEVPTEAQGAHSDRIKANRQPDSTTQRRPG